MSSSSSGNLDQLPMEIQKAVVEGRPILMFACRLRAEEEGVVYESLPHVNKDERTNDIDRQICEILHKHIDRLPRETLKIFQVLSLVIPHETPLVEMKFYIYLADNGGCRWMIVGVCTPAVEFIPGFSKAFENAGKEAIDFITEALV